MPRGKPARKRPAASASAERQPAQSSKRRHTGRSTANPVPAVEDNINAVSNSAPATNDATDAVCTPSLDSASVNGPGSSIQGSTAGNEVASIYDSLGANVSESVKQKIVKGDFIDLGQLLSNPIPMDGKQTLTISNGQVVIEPKRASVKITNVQQWTDAFLIFSSIYSVVHPEIFLGLLKYIHTIRLGATRCAGIGWKFYDEQFRMRMAKNPSASWGVVDQELWLMYMIPSANPVQKPLTGGRFLKCYDFNNYGVCVKQQCQYLHKCLNCSGPHPSVMCVGSSNYKRVARDFSGHRSPSPYRSQIPSPRPTQPHRARFPYVPRAAGPRFFPN